MTVVEALRRFPWRRNRSGSGPNLNERLAVWLTAKVGTMWAAYVVAAMAVVSLPAALATRNTVVIVGWALQTLFQGAALPIIMVGQDVSGRRTEATITDTHELAKAEHEQTRTVLADLADSHQDLHTLVAGLAETHADLHTLLQQVAEVVPEVKAVMAAVGAITTELTPGDGTAQA